MALCDEQHEWDVAERKKEGNKKNKGAALVELHVVELDVHRANVIFLAAHDDTNVVPAQKAPCLANRRRRRLERTLKSQKKQMR
jgi:hypothetical protein